MKTFSKIKGIFYRNVIIQDEGGLDIIQIKKQLQLSLLAAHLRQLAGYKIPLKISA